MLHRFDPARIEVAGSETKIGKLDVTCFVYEEVFRFQVAVNIAKLVQGIDRTEHLGDVKSSMLLLQDPRVVQESPEVSTWYILLRSEHVYISFYCGQGGIRPSNIPLPSRYDWDLGRHREEQQAKVSL